MSVTSQQVLEDLMRALGDIDALVKAQAAKPANNGSAAEDPELERRLAAIRARINGVKDAITHEVHRRVEAVDNYFHENTWKTVGIAAGIAFFAGLLLGRPSRSSED
jgi:ElaB/YqjD/DUF883 family membrane-anchored ribosome-binding protein